MKKTTLKAIRDFNPCGEGWRKLLSSLGNPEDLTAEVTYLQILESNGIEDAIWALRTDTVLAVQYAVNCSEAVLSLFESKFPNDDRPRKAIEAAKAYIANPNSETADATYAAARAAAYAAYAAADAAAYAAADAAAYSAADAAAAAYAAADAAARAAARAAAYSAADAADAAYAAAYSAADAADATYAAEGRVPFDKVAIFVALVSQEN